MRLARKSFVRHGAAWACRGGILLLGILATAGCLRVKSDPIEVNINVRLQMDDDLRQMFRDLDAIDRTKQTPAAEKTGS